MDNIILKIESIKKSFLRNIIDIRGKKEDERFYIVDDLDLLIHKGKITALIGGNGAGKTTLFNIISGFIKADSGLIMYNNNQISLIGLPPYKITRLGIGRMFQDNHIFQDMNILDNMLKKQQK